MSDFGPRRPRGLRLSPARGLWWRIDSSPPQGWDWTPFSTPRGRFDPPSGRFRLRYAANIPAASARERFPARALTEADGELWIVGLEGMPSALHLTHQANLDFLGLDDRVSTGRIDVGARRDPDPLLDTCGRLSDALYDWWASSPPPLVYRSRSTPEQGRNIAFSEQCSPRVAAAGRLRDATALHAYLVLRAGFTVPAGWIA